MANGERIDELIASVTDPQVRTTLILLGHIDTSLSANTRATEMIAERLEAHIKDFEHHKVYEGRMIASFKGVWWAGITLIGAIITLGGYIVTQHIHVNERQDVTLEALQHRITVLEQKFGDHLDQSPRR